MAKSSTKSTAKKSTAKAANTTRNTSAEPQGDHTHLATAAEEDKMREAATKPAAVKAAVKAGKKDPIEKFGDPDADPVEMSVRRANFG